MFELGQKVKVLTTDELKQDPLLEDLALQIIQKDNFVGEVTKIEDDLYYVGFKNDFGWVTQIFESNEIKEVK